MIRNSILRIGIVTLAATALFGVAGCDSGPTPEECVFIDSLGKATFTVYPTFVRQSKSSEYYAATADDLAKLIRDEKYGEATVSTEQPVIAGGWRMNEAAMWKTSIASLGDHVKAHPIQTDYAVMGEFLMGPPGKQAVAIHVYIVDREGKKVTGVLANDHNATFDKGPRSTTDECNTLLLKLLKDDIANIKAAVHPDAASQSAKP